MNRRKKSCGVFLLKIFSYLIFFFLVTLLVGSCGVFHSCARVFSSIKSHKIPQDPTRSQQQDPTRFHKIPQDMNQKNTIYYLFINFIYMLRVYVCAQKKWIFSKRVYFFLNYFFYFYVRVQCMEFIVFSNMHVRMCAHGNHLCVQGEV